MAQPQSDVALQTTYDRCNCIYTSVIFIWLVSTARGVNSKFWASYKMFNVTEDKSQSPRNIIECSNAEKSKYDDYLAISVFKLLSYVVVVDAWLGESGENFVWRWAILEIRPLPNTAVCRA